MKFFVSGYGDGKGPVIKLFEGDSAVWEWAGPNASWVEQAGALLFSVQEEEGGSSVVSFVKEGASWKEADKAFIQASALCHLKVYKEKNLIFGSCWGDGTFFALEYSADGSFGKIKFLEKEDDGTGRKSRCHCVQVFDGHAYAMNIELDKIFCYSINDGGIKEVSHFSFPLGEGPRHALVNKEKRLMYVVTEYSSRLWTLDISDPLFPKAVQSLSMLPCDFMGASTGSTLAITADNKHLYAANRGADTIAHFFIDKYGLPVPANEFLRKGFNVSVLEEGLSISQMQKRPEEYFHSGEQPKKIFEVKKFRQAEQTSCGGMTPRHIALLDDDKFLAVALQHSNKVSFFERNGQTGSLSEKPVKEIPFALPTFVGQAE